MSDLIEQSKKAPSNWREIAGFNKDIFLIVAKFTTTDEQCLDVLDELMEVINKRIKDIESRQLVPKQLEWENDGGAYWKADTVFGTYCFSNFIVVPIESSEPMVVVKSENQAKEYCQLHYNELVYQCIETNTDETQSIESKLPSEEEIQDAIDSFLNEAESNGIGDIHGFRKGCEFIISHLTTKEKS